MTLLALFLSGCSVIDRLAVRLNVDGSFDVATCERLDVVDTVSAEVYGWADDLDDFTPLRITSTPISLSVGEVIRLEAPPSTATWDQLSISMTGVWERPSGSLERTISGTFNREDLVVDEWLWARNYFAGSIQECEIVD